jgi:hypothetical protein
MTLYEEIVSKCTPAEIAAGNHHVIAAKVNVGRVRTEKTPIADVQAFLQTNGTWWAIKAAAKDITNPAYEAADAVMDVASARYTNLDMSLPIIGQMFGGLVTAGIITAAQRDTIIAMGQTPDPVTYLQCGDAIEKGI